MITYGYDRFPSFFGFDFHYNFTQRFLVLLWSLCIVLIPRAEFYSSDFRLFPCNAGNWLYNHPGIYNALNLYTYSAVWTLQLTGYNLTPYQRRNEDKSWQKIQNTKNEIYLRYMWMIKRWCCIIFMCNKVNNYLTVLKFSFVCTCVSKYWLIIAFWCMCSIINLSLTQTFNCQGYAPGWSLRVSFYLLWHKTNCFLKTTIYLHFSLSISTLLIPFSLSNLYYLIFCYSLILLPCP